MKVIGTAGHIDHGKSTLVHALTGIDPDRLLEEKQRGMTIDLGFAWFTLPMSGDVSIVDVPGHERFVKNMLAGAGGIDVALLVIAADEAVMPQTREHVAILDLLGISSGVVALTKADLVDEELLFLSESDVTDLLAGTSLERSPVVTVSSRTGEGIPQLLSVLDRQVSLSPDPAASTVPYLPIDRVFHVAGFGTVVTGTVHGGNFTVGDELQVVPTNQKVRVRGVQTHRRAATSVGPGSRAAINVVGASREDLHRGDVLAYPGTIEGIRRFDASLKVLADAPFALTDGLEVSLHIGAAEKTARIFLHGFEEMQPGSRGWVQVRTTEDVAVLRGQRFIIRLPAPGRTVAGGQVVETRPTRKRADLASFARFEQLSSPDARDVVAAALTQDRVHYLPRLATRLGLLEQVVTDELRQLIARGEVLSVNNAYIDRRRFDRIAQQARTIAQDYHVKHPLRDGTPSEEMRRKLRWDASEWSGLVKLLNEHRILESRGSSIAIPDHVGGSGAHEDLADQVIFFLKQQGFSPPSWSDITASTGASEDLLQALINEDRIVRLPDALYVEKSVFDQMVDAVRELIRRDGQVTVATVRDAFGTSRKSVLALMEYLDSKQITRRTGDSRILGRKGNGCA